MEKIQQGVQPVVQRYEAHQIGKADNQNGHRKPTHKFNAPRHCKMRSQHRTQNITQTVPQTVGIIDLVIHHKYNERKWSSQKYNKALYDVSGDDIQLHRPDGDSQNDVT